MSVHRVSGNRITVYFSSEQVEWLNEIALARSTSVSDILRRLVDETRGAYLTPADARSAETNATNETGTKDEETF